MNERLTDHRMKMAMDRLDELWPSLAEPKAENAQKVLRAAIDAFASGEHCDRGDGWEQIFSSREKFQTWAGAGRAPNES